MLEVILRDIFYLNRSFSIQQAIDYSMEVVAHGEAEQQYSKYDNFDLHFLPLSPGMQNVAFTPVRPIIQAAAIKIVSTIPAQIHRIRPHIPLHELEAAFSLAEQIGPVAYAESAIVETEAFQEIITHPHFHD